ncbi:DUF5320 family protein [Ammonifex thiophilus]|uniref:DUF5320 domain-containing protein n=1 Tax=Ammonifex thiophilus TaxID=444093 RepID=A0A3D8P6A1_9THEO|nr:DUF5320 family protein [Ammonifex thiophilus]RDV84027.1 hypothetical protein DXX99_04140 [Ammonifex thiophilus]
MPWGFGFGRRWGGGWGAGWGRGWGWWGGWRCRFFPWLPRRWWAMPGWGAGQVPPTPWAGTPAEAEFLRQEANFLRQQLQAIEQRLQELERRQQQQG